MTIKPISNINTRSIHPMRFPNPLAFSGRTINSTFNPLRYPSPIANHAGDTIVSKIKPLNEDMFVNSKFMTK